MFPLWIIGGHDIQKRLLNKIRLKFESFHNHEYTDLLKFDDWYDRMCCFPMSQYELDQISNDGYEDYYGDWCYSDYSDYSD